MSWKTLWIKSRDLSNLAYALEIEADLRDMMSNGRHAAGAYAVNAQRKAGVSEDRFATELNRLGLYDILAATLSCGSTTTR